MLRGNILHFLYDEQGGGTIMGLLWFILITGICGMAVDSTNGFRNRTMLQATADTAALAAVIDLPNKGAAVATAVTYASVNMGTDQYGDVLLPEQVEVGTWDHATRTYQSGGIAPDAVRVYLHQTEANSNPVPVNFLRIIGLQSWNINVQAVAQRFVPDCLRDGLVARGLVDISSNNGFVNRICIHGQQGVSMSSNNSYEIGVSVSAPDLDTDLKIPASGMASNTGLNDALRERSMDPRMVNHVDEYMDDLLALKPYIMPSYINLEATSGSGGGCVGFGCATTSTALKVLLRDEKWDFADATPGNVYHIQCAANKTVGVPSNMVLTEMVIVADCHVTVGSGVTLIDVVLASRSGGNDGAGGQQGGGVSGQGGAGVQNANISFGANGILGADDNCLPGGGVQIFTNASVHFSSSMTINGLQIVAKGDVDLGARDGGINGINVQTGGNITLTSNNMFGICSGGSPNFFPVFYYRLVA